MNGFKPSGTFVTRVMADVRAYEATIRRDNAHIKAHLFSKPTLCALSAAGALLGILNVVRIASILVSPAFCF